MNLMNNVKKLEMIYDGWKNFIWLSEAVEELAHVRAEICSSCPHAVESKWMQKIGDKEIEQAAGIKCNLCSCPISAKARSVKSICPDTPRRW